MKNLMYFMIFLLISLVSCQKDDLDTNSPDTTQGVDTLTTFNLHHSKKPFTVVGHNDPAVDIAAVQHAVDNYKHIQLTGVFDFGDDQINGGVDITKPNVLLKGPATILNGAKYENNEVLGHVNYPLSIKAPGTIIWKLEFKGDHNGIYVNSQDHGRCVVLAGNKIEGLYTAIIATGTSGGIKILNNILDANFGYRSKGTKGATVIFNNDISASLDGVRIFEFDHRLYILNNQMNDIAFTGIWIGAWVVTEDSGPEWGDNRPVRISSNRIDIVDPYAGGILVGGSNFGINNTLVANNTLTGVAGYGGLVKPPYGHNNTFINNDLSGLVTNSPQIWVHGGYNNLFKNNKLGRAEPFWASYEGAAQRDAATLVSVINWHYKDNWLDTPDPVNYGNKFINNDYRQTGVAGWTDDTEGSYGAVVLLDFLERYDANYTPSDIPYIMENYVNEHKFPNGTDVCDQVLDLSNEFPNDMIPGNNHIVGWKECEANSDKVAFRSEDKPVKAVSLRMKEIQRKRAQALEKERR